MRTRVWVVEVPARSARVEDVLPHRLEAGAGVGHPVPGLQPLGEVEEGRDLLGVRHIRTGRSGRGTTTAGPGMGVRSASTTRSVETGQLARATSTARCAARLAASSGDRTMPAAKPQQPSWTTPHREADVVGGHRRLQVQVLQGEELAARRDHAQGGVLGPELAGAGERGVRERGERQGQELGVHSRHEGRR